MAWGGAFLILDGSDEMSLVCNNYFQFGHLRNFCTPDESCAKRCPLLAFSAALTKAHCHLSFHSTVVISRLLAMQTRSCLVISRIKFRYLSRNTVLVDYRKKAFIRASPPRFTVVSRMVTVRRFPGNHFSRMRQFLMIIIYRRTLNMNNTLYKFIPRRKANFLALLTP